MNEKENSRQIKNSFHLLINQYFSGNLFSNFEKSLLFSALAKNICKKYAPDIVDQFKSVPKADTFNRGINVTESIEVDHYKGDNPYVLRLMDQISMHLKPFLIGAYLHGSLATNEEINYSDLDAVLILRDNIFSNPNSLGLACYHIIRARKILNEYDPLQHHSFIILVEFYLQNYYPNYFPPILFHHSKSLTEKTSLELTVNSHCAIEENVDSFSKMASVLKKKLENKKYPRTYYDLKLLLSQMMLLPSFYLQAKGIYVYKKDSFDLVKKDFTPNDWSIMDRISQIRNDWDFHPSPAARFIETITRNPFFMTMYQKRGQHISKKLESYLTDDFYSDMLFLILKMEATIGLNVGIKH